VVVCGREEEIEQSMGGVAGGGGERGGGGRRWGEGVGVEAGEEGRGVEGVVWS